MSIFLALLGILFLISGIAVANSTRPGTRKRWLRAMLAAALGGIGLMLALKPATAMAGELITAPVLAQARHPGGAVIMLHGVEGPCSAGAKLATFIAPNGVDKVNGCYKANAESGTVGMRGSTVTAARSR